MSRTEYSPAITALIDKLSADHRTKDTPRDLAACAADHYLAAVNRNHWSNKTQAARDAWLAKFEKTMDALLELMAEAPTTPESWGFPAHDYVLMNLAYRWGIDLPPSSDTMGFFTKMRQLEEAADAELWSLADALSHYREQQRLDCQEPQILKKPADADAGRAQFITTFRESSKLSAAKVATIATVLFGRETDERVVRRLTERTHSPKS